RHPDTDIFLIVGADAASDLATWDRPDVIRDLATIVIVSRADIAEPGPPGPDWRVEHVRIPPLAISSTDLRRRAAAGDPLEGLMPAAAIPCLRERGLYADRG
ncbi:MAG: nicotinate-nucleotide adenylyltransferase, partial [Acidimicrobiia bacterium]|nr:nicotinate-nucleotide adenylyltransferase [Acidimicrobiia bacterium]